VLKRRRGITQQDSHPVRGADGFDDERLVRLLRGGNEPAFIALVGRHHGAMIRLARFLCSEQDDG
jgi:hypothetical protein